MPSVVSYRPKVAIIGSIATGREVPCRRDALNYLRPFPDGVLMMTGGLAHARHDFRLSGRISHTQMIPSTTFLGGSMSTARASSASILLDGD